MLFVICYKYVKQKIIQIKKNKIMEKINGEQKEPIKITTAVEDIIEVIKRNETSEVKCDLLLLVEEKLKKETDQRFNAYRVGKIEIISDTLRKKSFEVKELFDELKSLDVMGSNEYEQTRKDFFNVINS